MRPAVAPLMALILTLTVLAGCLDGRGTDPADAAADAEADGAGPDPTPGTGPGSEPGSEPGTVPPPETPGPTAPAPVDIDRDAPPPGTQVFVNRTGHEGAEPNIGITSSGKVFVTAWDRVITNDGDGGRWRTALTGIIPTNDPMLWVDPDTDRIFVPSMKPILTCSEMVFSDDDGVTWTTKPLTCGIPVVDHQKVTTGPFVADGHLVPTVYPNVVYYCYNKVVGTFCAISADGGLTFPYDRPVSTGSCGGINGHPATARDGTVYVPLANGCSTLHIAVSTDNGFTWTAKDTQLPNDPSGIDPDVTVTPDGAAYALYRGLDHKMHLARSGDQWDSIDWDHVVSPEDVESTVFQAISSGDDGRLAWTFLGTDHEGPADRAPDDATWHLYTGMTLDARKDNATTFTWRATPLHDPVQRGSICLEGIDCDGDRNLLDFIDLHVGPDGRPWVAFTDGCIGGCVTKEEAGPSDSRADATSFAVWSAGPGLLAGKDLVDLGLGASRDAQP